ncbi:unnamed protein product [Commensalibacter communis]|nr:unnamed protein product [Commensalibacter communis]
MLVILTNRHPSEIYKLISEEKDYYNNISSLIHIITYLIFYLSKNPSNFFLLLSQGT